MGFCGQAMQVLALTRKHFEAKSCNFGANRDRPLERQGLAFCRTDNPPSFLIGYCRLVGNFYPIIANFAALRVAERHGNFSILPPELA